MSSIESKEQQIRELAERLNPKHLLFVNNLLAGMSQEEAYVAAGYKPKGAKASASRLLTNANLALYLELQKEVASEKAADTLEITEERIMAELAKLGFSNIKRFYSEDGRLLNPWELDEDSAAAVTEIKERVIRIIGEEDSDSGRAETVIERQYKLADKKASLELLGKSNAIQMFKERQVIEGGPTPLGFILERIAEQTDTNDSPLPSEC